MSKWDFEAGKRTIKVKVAILKGPIRRAESKKSVRCVATGASVNKK